MPTLPTLNLLLARRFYSMVDEFTVICTEVDQVTAKWVSLQIGSLTTL